MEISYKWTDGSSHIFENFYKVTEEYYSQIVGGIQNRLQFVPHNVLFDIKDVLIAYDKEDRPIACACFKMYSKEDAEIKRVWVDVDFRKKHIAADMMTRIENRAKEKGYKRTILQTRDIMVDAVKLYKKLGYSRIDNYPPYDKLDGAICFGKQI